LDLCDSVYRPAAGFCEYGNGISYAAEQLLSFDFTLSQTG